MPVMGAMEGRRPEGERPDRNGRTYSNAAGEKRPAQSKGAGRGLVFEVIGRTPKKSF